jgi:hypothetical protein
MPKSQPEMAVTDIILAKIYRFCQLLSHSRRFFARVKIFKSIGSSPYRFLGGEGEGVETFGWCLPGRVQNILQNNRTSWIKIFKNPRCTFLQMYNVHCNTYILSPIKFFLFVFLDSEESRAHGYRLPILYGRSVTNILSQHKVQVQVEGGGQHLIE